MEQLNIGGIRSGDGFICDRLKLAAALARAQAPTVAPFGFDAGVTIGRKGLIGYLRAMGGSNLVKVVPHTIPASDTQGEVKGLKIACGPNTAHVDTGAWVSEKDEKGATIEVRVSRNNAVTPNLGAAELADAIATVIPFASTDDIRPVLSGVRFAQAAGKLTLAGCDGFRMAETVLDFEDGEAACIVNAKELRAALAGIRQARRVRLSIENKSVVIATEAIRYKWHGIDGQYPNYENVIPTDFKAWARMDTREALKGAASLAYLLPDKGDGPIILNLDAGTLTLTVKGEDSQAHIEATGEGTAKVAVNAKYLADVLKAIDGMATVRIPTESGRAVVFEGEDFRAVLMPLFLKADKPVPAAAQPAETPPVAEAVAPGAVAQAEAVAQAAAAVAEAEAVVKPPKRKSKAERKAEREAVAV